MDPKSMARPRQPSVPRQAAAAAAAAESPITDRMRRETDEMEGRAIEQRRPSSQSAEANLTWDG